MEKEKLYLHASSSPFAPSSAEDQLSGEVTSSLKVPSAEAPSSGEAQFTGNKSKPDSLENSKTFSTFYKERRRKLKIKYLEFNFFWSTTKSMQS